MDKKAGGFAKSGEPHQNLYACLRLSTSAILPLSPVLHETQQEWPTPVRTRIRSDRFDYSMTYESIHKIRDIPETSIRRNYNAPILRRSVYSEKTKEKRGAKAKIILIEIRLFERFLEDNDFYA